MLGFRVWDRNNECFVTPEYSEYVEFWMTNKGELWQTDDGGESCRCHSHFYIPLQSTALFDQMGKELYEGDIIMVGQIDGDYRPGILLFCESIPQIYNLLMGRYRKHPFTVIGNAYENPGLLEKIKC